MLALATGWTPDVLADLPGPFRRACHWALFTRTIVGSDGLIEPERPAVGSSLEARKTYGEQMRDIARIRKTLFPEDE